MELIIRENTIEETLVTTSKGLAIRLGKSHNEVIAELENILIDTKTIVEEDFAKKLGEWIMKSIDADCYILTKDGVTLYMLSVEGYADEKLQYIKKMSEMEKKLQQQQRPKGSSFREALLLAAQREQEKEILALENKQEIIDNDPTVNFEVNAIELYKYLEVQEDYIIWIERNLKELNLIDGLGYTKIETINNDITTREYLITQDVSREIAMISDTEKAREVREYFIGCENLTTETSALETTGIKEALLLAVEEQEKVEQFALENKEKKECIRKMD